MVEWASAYNMSMAIYQGKKNRRVSYSAKITLNSKYIIHS